MSSVVCYPLVFPGNVPALYWARLEALNWDCPKCTGSASLPSTLALMSSSIPLAERTYPPVVTYCARNFCSPSWFPHIILWQSSSSIYISCTYFWKAFPSKPSPSPTHLILHNCSYNKLSVYHCFNTKCNAWLALWPGFISLPIMLLLYLEFSFYNFIFGYTSPSVDVFGLFKFLCDVCWVWPCQLILGKMCVAYCFGMVVLCPIMQVVAALWHLGNPAKRMQGLYLVVLVCR